MIYLRNPFLRVGGILANTAMDIGKDYTSNFQTFISDADQVKQSVMHIGTGASESFARIMKAGPIKSALDWFYSKESESDEWSLDGPDNDFDGGFETSDDSSDDEKKGPATLDVDSMKDVARGHINSMTKIAHKIAEAQVAGTAEIISNMNTRTSELIAATNNINTTLLGISKKLDSITSYVNARTYEAKKNERTDSLYDYNGRLTLGSVFDASKNSLQNSGAASIFSLMKTMGGSGMMTPEFITRLLFDFTLGDKNLKFLGDQSINTVGEKINDAIGQSISDVLEKTISTKLFKNVFGDITKEKRSTNFGTYVKNEYTREAAVFDGMTRTSIVKTIPAYLQKIYEAISGKTLNIDKTGGLTTKEGYTWNKLVGDTLFNRNAMASEDMRSFTKSTLGNNVTYTEANLIGTHLTGLLISYMIDEGITKPDISWINPNNYKLVGYAAQMLAKKAEAAGNDKRTPDDWLSTVQAMLTYISSDRGVMNRFRGELTQKYNDAFKALQQGAGVVVDQTNVGSLNMLTAANAGMNTGVNRFKLSSTPSSQNQTGPIQQIGSNEDLTRIIGHGPGDETTEIQTRSMSDTLSDIRTLLSAGVQSLVGNEEYRSIEGRLTKPTMVHVESPGIIEVLDNRNLEDEEPTSNKQLSKAEAIRQFKNGGSGELMDITKESFSDVWGAIKQGGSDVLDSTRVNGKNTGLTNALSSGGRIVSDVATIGADYAGRAAGMIKDFGQSSADAVKKFVNSESKEDAEDRDTVNMINAAMQTAIQNGNVSQDEKNSINQLINSLHNKSLQRKLSKSVTNMLDRASVKADPESDSGKKGIFGKLLSGLKLILSPVKLIAKGVTTLVPIMVKGFGTLMSKVFGGDVRQLKAGIAGVGSGFKDMFGAIREGVSNKAIEAREARAQRAEEKARQKEEEMERSRSGGIILDAEGTFLGRAGEDAEELRDEHRKEELRAEKNRKRREKADNGGKFAQFTLGFAEGFAEEGPKVSRAKVEGVDEEGEGFISKVLAKFFGIFKGTEESVFSKIEQTTTNIEEETKEDEQSKPNEGNDADEKPETPTDGSTDNDENKTGGNVQGLTGQSNNSGRGSLMDDIKTTGGGLMQSAPTVPDGAVLPNAAQGATGVAGALMQNIPGGNAMMSTVFKIGKSVGKIVKSLGTIGMAVAKMVLKAIVLLKGFKSLMGLFSKFKDDIGKIISIAFKPISKIFEMLTRVIKPILVAVENVLEGLMKGIGKLLDAVIGTITPLIENILNPIINTIVPILDMVIDILEPFFDMISAMIEVLLTPLTAAVTYVLVPIVKTIGYTLQTIMGVVEMGFGALMIPIGAIVAGLGGILKAIGKIPIIPGRSSIKKAGKNLSSQGKDMMSTGATLIEQGKTDIKDGIAGIKSTAIKAFNGIDQTDDFDDESGYFTNPNANESTTPGSVMDGTITGNGNVDSHNMIWNISNIYGRGDSQKSYGNTLSMSNNGCGPMALADAFNRRSGSNVSGLSVAKGMASGGTYEPGRGTSVASFMSASNAMGMNLKAGGVTAGSLKNASPSNPITVVGSGSDFGTKSGNNHYMNVIGTDRYGGAYVSNPLTGRVDRRSATTLASSSVLGLYGSGDSAFTFPDAVQNAFANLKEIAGNILGMFNKSAKDTMKDTLNKAKTDADISRLKDDYNKYYGDGSFEDAESQARELALADYEKENPRLPGETEISYMARFNKWYDSNKQWEYLAQSQAISDFDKKREEYDGNINKMLEEYDTSVIKEEDRKSLSSAYEGMRDFSDSAWEDEDDDETSGGRTRGGAGEFVSAVAKVFEGLVNKEPRLVYSNTDHYDITTRDGTTITNVRPDCSGIIGAAIKSMGYGLKGSDASNLYTFSFQGHTGDNDIITNSDGELSNDWLIMPFDVDKKQPGDVLLNTEHHMGMYIVPNPGGQGRNYGFDGGATDSNSQYEYTGTLTGGIHGSAKYATEWLDSSGSITDRYHGNVWTQPDVAIDGASAPQYILRYVKPDKLYGWNDEQKIWAHLINNGATPEGAAGFMGVWQYESNNNPNALEGVYDHNDATQAKWVQDAYSNPPTSMDNYVTNILFPTRYPGNKLADGRDLAVDGYKHDGHWYPGVGIAQWTGLRTKELFDYSDDNNTHANTVDAQMGFFKSEQGKYSYLKSYYDQANAASTPEEAADIVVSKYQGAPSDTAKAIRKQYAREFYDLYKDWTNTSTSAMSPTGKGSVLTGLGMVTSAADERLVKSAQNIKTTTGKNKGVVNTHGNGEPLGLRQRPSNEMGSNVLIWIPNGTELDLEVSDTKGWFKTSYGGYTGYVNSTYIDLLENYVTELNLTEPEIPTSNKQNTNDIPDNAISRKQEGNVILTQYSEEEMAKKVAELDEKNANTLQNEFTGYFTSKENPWNFFVPENYDLHNKSERNAAFEDLASIWKGRFGNYDASNINTMNQFYKKYPGFQDYIQNIADKNGVPDLATVLRHNGTVLDMYAIDKLKDPYIWSDLYNNASKRPSFNAYATGVASLVAPNTYKKYNSTTDILGNATDAASDLFHSLLGSGDTDALSNAMANNANDLVGVSQLMQSFNIDGYSSTSTDEDIPGIDQSTLDKITSATQNNGGVTIIKADTSAKSKLWDDRLKQLLNNTYKVKSDRIEELLQMILDRMDSNNGNNQRPSRPSSSDFNMFTDSSIPQAVQRLVRG